MSMNTAQDLLRKYNQKSPYDEREPIDSQADQHSKKFGTWSYANMYDALYNRFSSNQNFNVNMWHQAIKLGEQDQYLALLERNKDSSLSKQFYDPQYYNYESMMLELYKPFADGTKKTPRTRDVYDQVSEKWVTEDLGEMSDREYIQYQLDQAYSIRQQEITKELEQQRKDNLNWAQKFANDVAATLGEFGEGILSGVAGILDTIIAVGSLGTVPYAMEGFEGNYLDAFVNYFGENSLTALERETIRAALDEYERTSTSFRDIDGNMTGVGKYVAGIANSMGMMAPAIAITVLTGGTAAPAWLGNASFYASIFSSNMYENATNQQLLGSPSSLKILNAGIKTGVEAVIEWGLGKVVGGTIQNQLLGLRGGANALNFTGLTRTTGLKYLARSAIQEGAEEFLQDFGTHCVNEFMAMWNEGYGNDGVTMQTLWDSFCIGALSSMVMSGGQVAANAAINARRNRVDPGSGDLLIETEDGPQKVKGLNRLYYSNILSNFQDAVDSLKSGKLSATKNVELAQEVYTALSSISQFYSSFDNERIKNCQRLLNRVVEAEKFETYNRSAASILSSETVARIKKHDKGVKTTITNETRARAKVLAANIEVTVNSMIKGVGVRHAEKLHNALEKSADALEEAGVTEATAVIDANGIQYKDADREELEKRIGKKGINKIEELRKGYEWLITVDGHVAIESDGYLFVSEPWLMNYTVDEIYKYLEQTRVVEALTTDKTLSSMVKRIVAFDKEFTGKKDVNETQALMDFLFNKSVYQGFLLSNGGRNATNYKQFIFQVHDIIKGLAERSKYQQQRFKGKLSQRRVNMLNEIYEQIKETMRGPTLKAILNWGWDPQVIGADNVLTDADQAKVLEYKAYLRSLNGELGVSAYRNLKKDIIIKSQFDDETLQAIERGSADDATIDERVQARAILDYADRLVTMYDFEYRNDGKRREIGLGAFTVPYQAILAGNEAEIQFVTDVLNEFEQRYGISIKQMMCGDFDGMSFQEQDQLAQDMEILGIGADDILVFVMTRIENMLGNKYTFVPYYDKFGMPYDFDIVKAIPADAFLPQYLLDLNNDERNDIFLRTLNRDRNIDDAYKYLTSMLNRFDGLGLSYTRDYLEEVIEGLNDFRLEDIREGFDPVTGIVFYNPSTDEVYDEELYKVYGPLVVETKASLTEFFDFSKFPDNLREFLSSIEVRRRHRHTGSWSGRYSNRTIEINDYLSDDCFGTLVHEVNHAIQDYYNLPNGFNTRLAEGMPDFLTYVANHYATYVKYVLRMQSKYDNDFYRKIGTREFTEGEILALDGNVHSLLAYCAYTLVQGEIWAREYVHNEKSVHGFTTGIRLTSPDGETSFENVSDELTAMSKAEQMPKPVAESALDVAIQNLFLLRGRISRGEVESTYRNTYHSAYTGRSSTEITQKLMGPNVPFFMQFSLKLDDLIKNPDYLSQEIKDKLNGDFYEGNVFYRVKEYVEANYEGISIDRSASNNTYIFVNDNAFDDILLSTTRAKTQSTGTSIVDKYATGKRIPLTEFYQAKQLALLGIDPSAYVVIGPDQPTETVFDTNHKAGAIFINSTDNHTDAEFIDALNHEFRHVIQRYHGFEEGFTPDFKVTKEMLADVKKHVPGLFKNEKIVSSAKAAAGKDWEERIVQHFVYFVTGGELNAYAFPASELYAKPAFVKFEAGRPTIFMPWYNAQTGDGRYKTEFLANRAIETPKTSTTDRKTTKTTKTADEKTPKKRVNLPKVDKKPKYKSKKIETVDDVIKATYVYENKRHFTKKKAQGTNLMKFYKPGRQNQMDPDLQEFVIATTGHEDEIAPEIMNAINKGILTKQALFKWFREVDVAEVNQFTFDLLNAHFFKNSRINSMQELDDVLSLDPSFYWAVATVFRREGLEPEQLGVDNDIDKLLTFLKDLKNTKYADAIEKTQVDFNEQWMSAPDGKYVKEDIGWSDRVQNYARVLAMQWFDGTLAGAFYMAGAFRKTARKYEEEIRGTFKSTDSSQSNQKGDKALSIGDKITKANTLVGNSSTVANDIIAVYELQTDKTAEEMIGALTFAYAEHLAKELDVDFERGMDFGELLAANPELGQDLILYVNELRAMDFDDIEYKYAELMNAEMTDTSVPDTTFTGEKTYKNTRVNIVRRIKGKAKTLLKYVREGKIAFKSLPSDIQDMFELTTGTTKGGKKIQDYVLKPEVYSVGRGRKALPGVTDTGRLDYVPKHDITKGSEAFRHDVTEILANDQKLRDVLKVIRESASQQERTKREMEKAMKKKSDELDAEMKRSKRKSTKKSGTRETEFKVSVPKSRISDTPNNFTIVSGVDMPHILYKIFDVSFTAMADTKVQFASRDENGQLYDPSQFTDKEFKSRLQHEMTNWDAFYEANRETLINLSHNDVIEIVDFLQHGVATLDGPASKLAAFEVFILGYLVDGARRNINDWNLAQSQVTMIEKLYENKASEHGSGLKAVQQMLKVIDPMKQVRQRMLERYNIGDDELKPLFEAVDELQKATDSKTREARTKDAISELRKIEAMMVENDITERGWGKRWYQKLKSYRYMAMLSSPITWIRNKVSNASLFGLNYSADLLGGWIFPKKGYRKEQWNLSKVEVSQEVKAFIDENIKNNELLDATYDKTSRYENHSKKAKNRRDMFVSLIVRSLEQKYAAEHRFDSKIANNISKFVSNRISDRGFIKFVTNRYLGKMLTIEVQKGNIDLSKGLSDDVLNLFAEAVILGNVEYMHKRSFLADMIDGLKDKHRTAYEVLTFWQPFLNSSFNWFQETLKYTPVGLVNAIVRMCKLEQQISEIDRRRADGEMIPDSRVAEFLIRRDIGKGTVGLIFTLLGVLLALTGVLKLEEDDDKFYVIAGDVKFDISNIFGTSSLLVGASVAQCWVKDKNMGWEEILRLTTEQMVEGFVLNDILARHRWDDGFLDGLLTETESVLKSFVPQIVQLAVRTFNNEQIRYSPGMRGVWERWLNSWVPTQPAGHRRINPYTGEVETKYAMPIIGELAKSGLFGPRIYWSEVTEIERMCRELGVNKNELTGELKVGDKVHWLNRNELNQKYGELNKDSLAKIKSQKHRVKMPNGTFSTLSWDKMSDEQRANVLERTMEQNATLAKVYIWTQVMGKKYYGSASIWRLLRELGITRNVYKGDKGFAE
ncbi:MAG: hypothetical protein IKW20_08315 [Bacteroidales bacterium]|nr:hypothetical protein [Bacteroidales bacterium]